MRKKKIKLVITVLVVLFLILLVRPVYFGAPISGKIVDGVTDVPIDKAIVVAVSKTRSLLHGGNGGYAALLEAVTDADGNYRLPGWGPNFASKGQRVGNAAPTIIVYKSGYAPLQIENDLGNKGSVSIARIFVRSQHDGETLELQRFGGQITDYFGIYGGYLSRLLFFLSLDHPCLWNDIPLLLTSMVELDAQFSQAGIVNQFSGLVTAEAQASVGNCEAP